MKLTRLASAISFTLLSLSAAEAAQYKVVEMDTSEIAENAYARALNSSGQMAVVISDEYEPPIDLDLIDFTSSVMLNGLEDIAAAKVGNFTTDDYEFLYSYIKNSDGSLYYQQLADYTSYIMNDNEETYVKGFDVIDSDLDGYTRSTETKVRGINDLGWVVGSSEDAYYKIDYTSEEENEDITYVINDFSKHGFVQIGDETVDLVPTEDLLNGISEAYDINDSYQVVGWGTTEVLDSFEDSVEDCEDEDERGDIPYLVCLKNLIDSADSAYQKRGMIWQLDSSGNIIKTEELGLLLTPSTEDEDTVYTSVAVAINDNGVAVGYSDDYYQDSTTVATFAAIFDGNEVTGFTDHQEYFTSYATDINNNDIVTGYAYTTINGSTRTKFYIYDIYSGQTTYPDDFFPGSSSVAHAINDDNLVVGEGEVEYSTTGTRRKEAFIYDINDNLFQNLNDLIVCTSDYTIVQAYDINDDGEIAATATVRRTSKDIKGEEELDDKGDPIEEDQLVAVRLEPITGGVEEACDDDSGYERQGASNGWWGLTLLSGLVFWRRRKVA